MVTITMVTITMVTYRQGCDNIDQTTGHFGLFVLLLSCSPYTMYTVQFAKHSPVHLSDNVLYVWSALSTQLCTSNSKPYVIILWFELQEECDKLPISVIVSHGNTQLYIQQYSLFTFMMTSKLGCDDFICNIVYSLIS